MAHDYFVIESIRWSLKGYIKFTGVDLTGLQFGDPVIVDARGYLSFFVFFLFLEFKDEFRHDFFNTISS